MLFSTPALPLLFQGEEYGEEAPFDYFTSHRDPALAEAVRQGRHQEYLHLLEEGAEVGSWANPQAEETFQRAKLRWESIARSPHAEMLAFYRALIALRRRLPPLHNGRKDLTRVTADEAARSVTIERGDPSGAATFTAANFGPEEAPIRLPAGGARWELALATSSGAARASTGPPARFRCRATRRRCSSAFPVSHECSGGDLAAELLLGHAAVRRAAEAPTPNPEAPQVPQVT